MRQTRRRGVGSGRCRRMLAVHAVAWLLTGCLTTVRPPATPVAPVEVFLLDHGRSASLVLPRVDDGLDRYAYGDWRWYAVGDEGVAEALAALFWPTRGALGRQVLAGPADAAAVRAGVEVEIESLHPVTVGSGEVAALVARLDALFASRIATRLVNDEVGLEFVHHPRPYTLLHSSNHVVAEWLRELGCRVPGRPLLTRWRVRPRTGSGAAAQAAVDTAAAVAAP